jgi:cell division transport system permease protein
MYSLFSSLGTLLSHRLGTIMTVLVLGIAMLLPLGLYVTLENLRGLDLQREEWGAITVFLQSGLDQQQALDLAARIGEREDASAVVVSPEQGMEEFRQASGFGQALDLFEENPLPWVILVTPEVSPGRDLGAVVTALEGWLGKQDTIDAVQVDHKWLQRLSGMLLLGKAFATVLTVMFSLAVVVVIANTIRMDVAGRAEEIEVLSLVGASNNFIRQPFLYSGFWYGLLGALLALILLKGTQIYLQGPLQHLLDAYGNRFEISGLGGVRAGLLLILGGLLGLLGAWISVQRYLRLLKAGGTLGRI